MISIDELPDDVLLGVFDFYVDQSWGGNERKDIEGWQRLVHVCRRWRSVVFGSPRRLNLRLFCGRKITRGMVDVWPALPLVIQSLGYATDEAIALIECSDLVRRISQIRLSGVICFELNDVWEAMQVPFPELTHLALNTLGTMDLPLSDSFLGGSAPRLRFLELYHVPYPGLPKLLLSATHLTNLKLSNIPDSGYIPPEAMAASLSTLTSLKQLCLEFQFPPPLHDQESQRPSPSIRTSLPVLDVFRFRGGVEYLEVLVAHIDAPRLRVLDINLFNDIVFIKPQFTRFISRTPTFEAFDAASVDLRAPSSGITLSSSYARLCMRISKLYWELSFLEQVRTSPLPPLSTVHDLYMVSGPWPRDWKDNTDYAQWLELLRLFSGVKNIYLSKDLAPCVVPALQDLVDGRTNQVFPALQNIFLEELQESGPVQESFGKFVAARQVTSHPITVSRWGRYSN